MSITSNLPFSPLASPSPDHTSFSETTDTLLSMELRSPARHSPSYAPFRSSPLANSSTRATIRRISETGEMEMEDTEEMETDDVYVMEDDIIAIDESMDTEDTQDFQSSPFASINVEGLFRAGTPTPVVTPPFPQVTVPATHTIPDVTINNDGAVHLLLSLRETDSPGTEMTHTVVPDNLFDGIMEEEINGIDEILELGHEISTEELDTEFLDVRRRNFWNSWLRYRYRQQQQQGVYTSHIGSDWSDLLTFLLESRPIEVTEEQYDQGKDMQGLRWGVGDIPVKEDFREKRIKDYGSLIVKPPPQPASVNPAHDPSRVHNFFKFRYTNLNHRCSLHHFQLRYLLSATSKNDLFYISDNSLRRWDSMTRTSTVVNNFKQSRQAPWKGWMPSTLSCRYNLAAVGGYSGEYAVIPLNSKDPSSIRMGSLADSQYITNHVDVIQPRDGGVRVVWTNNDAKIRQQDVETGQFVTTHKLAWPINATSTSPDGWIRAAVGDAKEVVLMDASRGEVIKELWGHNHWSFAVDWRNDGYTFVTGNQDMSARLWDARKMSDSFLTLPGRMGAIRSVHFSPDGKYLAIAEPADYVHIYDASTGLYEDKQTIEFIGETAGVTFDPSGESLFIGNADDLVGSIYEFGRVHSKECVTSWEDIIL